MPMSLAEFFGDKIPDDGTPVDIHVKALTYTPVLRGYEAVVQYLKDVRGLPIGRPTIERATKRGELAHYVIGNGFSFTVVDIDEWLESQRVAAVR